MLTCYPEYLSLRCYIASKHCPLVHCNIQETKFHFGSCGVVPFFMRTFLIIKKKRGFHFKMSIKVLLRVVRKVSGTSQITATKKKKKTLSQFHLQI